MNQRKAIELARMVAEDKGGPYQTVAIELAKFVLEQGGENANSLRYTDKRDGGSNHCWNNLPIDEGAGRAGF